MADEVYLELDPEVFESIKKQSQEDFKKEYKNDESDSYWFPGLSFDCSEDEYKNGTLTLGGTLNLPDSETRLGYVSIKVDMDSDRVLEVISDYMKKLGKIKTVLEATKD